MAFVLKLIALTILLYLVHSEETIKSVKLNEKMIYDCTDIYKQPSLNHPLLQNHKIQMKPSFSIPISEKRFENKMYEKIIECPNGTVPILRNTKEYVVNDTYVAGKHFNPLSIENHGTHFAGVRLQDHRLYYGISSFLSVHDLNISGDQNSYAQIYVGSRINNKDNAIHSGWMINPTLFGDGRTWTYGFWKGANGRGCYNTICPGFVQVSKSDLIATPLPPAPVTERNIVLSIQRDSDTGNWWLTDEVYHIGIGYWPKELFDLLGNGAKVVGVGGVVESSPCNVSPPMGDGHRPTGEDMDAARFADVFVKDSVSRKFKKIDQSKLEVVIDGEKCYGVEKGKDYLFTYGGPGGNYCGI